MRDFLKTHPLLSAWGGLAAGMVAVLIFAAKDVGLLPGQLGALIISTIVLAGLCVWIINWD